MVGLVFRYGIYWFLGCVRRTRIYGSIYGMVVIVHIIEFMLYDDICMRDMYWFFEILH
jgi:hypothetical protein